MTLIPALTAQVQLPITPFNWPNLRPINCGGAVSPVRPRKTILHNEAGHCKRLL